MIIKWSWSMGLWCLWCTFLKWSGSEACANQGRSRWAAAPANESNSTPTVTIPKLQWTLSVLLHWVGNYIQYMILYVSLAIGAGFLLLCMTLFWLHETQKFRHKASEDIIANSFNLSNICQKDISIISITFNIDYHWISLIYHDLPVSLLSTCFHIFPRVHPFSSVFPLRLFRLAHLAPEARHGFERHVEQCHIPGWQEWQNVTSIKQVSNISKFTKVQVIQVIRKGCCMAASVQCIKSGVWLYWIPRNVICLLL